MDEQLVAEKRALCAHCLHGGECIGRDLFVRDGNLAACPGWQSAATSVARLHEPPPGSDN